MPMTKDEVIQYLLDRNYLVQLTEDNFVVTNKLDREANISDYPKTAKECTPSKEGTLLPKSELLRKFIKDCKIPFRAKTSMGGFYQLAAESEVARTYLHKVVSDKTYNYEDMVSATHSYYNNDKMARVTLTNYFKQGVFDQVMSEFSANPNSVGTILPKTNKVSL